METWTQVTANLSGNVRREVLNGRTFLVAPVTLLVSQVLPGSEGALYYPPHHVRRYPDSWNGMPITNYHPTVTLPDGTTRNVSARTPGVLNSQWLGNVYGVSTTDTEKGLTRLHGEAWFDEGVTQNRAPEVYRDLLDGQPIEVSTGLYTDKEPAPLNATFNGVPYTLTATNYRPDHLAVLHGKKGACGVSDGCGINVNESPKPRTESTTSKKRVGLLRRFVAIGKRLGIDPELVANLHPALQPHSKNTGRFKSLNAGTGEGDLFDLAQLGNVQLTDEDRRLGSLAFRELQEEGHNPASWVKDHAAWARAKGLARKGGYTGEHYWQVTAHIYQNIVGKGKGKKGKKKTTTNESPVPDPVPVVNASPTESPTEVPAMDRKKTVGFITANCDCWKGKDKVLEGLSDEALTGLEDTVKRNGELLTVVNGVRESAEAPESLTTNAIPAFIKERMKGEKKHHSTEEDDEEDEATEKKAKKGGKVTKNEDTDPDRDETDGADPRSMKEFLQKYGTSQEKAVWNSMVRENARKRAAIIGRLTANIKDTTKKEARVKRYQAMELDDLEALAEDLIPATNGRGPASDPDVLPADYTLTGDRVNYLGVGGGGHVPQLSVNEKAREDVLPVQEIDYEAIAKRRDR